MYFLSEKILANIFKTLIILLLFVISPMVTNAAALSVSPSAGNFEVGNRVTIKIIATSNTPLNAVSGLLSFPASTFSVESVSKSGSILNFWVTDPIVSNTNGTVKFEGVALGGFNGSTGTVISITLRATQAGSGNFSFQSGQILANDGEGTDITGNLIGANFLVTASTVKPATPKPEPNVPVVKEEQAQPAPTLQPPEILVSSKYGVPSIVGKSDYGGAQVLVTFTAIDGARIFILGVTETNGDFNLLVPNSLKRGLYTVTAVVVKADKTNSETSNVVVVKVGSIFSDIPMEVWIFILLLAITLVYLLVRIYFHFKKDKNIHKVIKKEISEAEDVLHKSFDILREDVLEYDEKKLTPTEHKRMAEFKRDIDSAEKVITKEVDDIR